MKKGFTEMVFILDRSGSMAGLERDTIGGFNAMIAKQKEAEGEAVVSTILFDTVDEVIHDRLNVKDVPMMTEDEYWPRGGTALIDAIGGAIHHIANIHKYAREEDVPEHTIFVITTDGMENASHRYNADEVRVMIKKEQEQYGWEFIFLGANIDAVETAKYYGIRTENAVNYHPDAVGTGLVYESACAAVTGVRQNSKRSDWRTKIDNDFRGRKSRR